MKKLLLFSIITLGYSQLINAQDSYKKRYYVKDKITYKEKYYNEKTEKTESKTSTLDLQSEDGKIAPKVLKIAKSDKGLLSNVAFGEKDNSNKLYRLKTRTS